MNSNYLIKLTVILLASIPLLACNGGNSNSNTSSTTTANPLQQYINLLTYTPAQGKQLSTGGSNQQSFSTPGGIQINSIDIKYYSGADCSGTATLITTLNGPSTPAEGTTSSNASNYALCGKYSSNGCTGLYNAVNKEPPDIRSIQYTYNLNNNVHTSQCLSNANNNPFGSGAFETIMNYSNPVNPVACTSGSSCGYSQPYPVVNLGLSTSSATSTGFAGGNGESALSAYQVEQNATPLPTISYTITNSGALAATDFYISGSASGWTVGGSCGTAGGKITLAATNGSCILTMTLTSTATTGAQNLDLSDLTMHWSDQANPSGQTQGLSGTSYVNIYIPASIAITTSPTSDISIAPESSFTITATLSGGYNVSAQTINAELTTGTQGAVTFTNNNCTVSSQSSTCTITITATNGAAAATGDVVTVNNNTTQSMTVTPPTMTFDIAAPVTPKLHIFLTSTTYNGDLKTAGGGTDGFDGANKLCATRAAAGSKTSTLSGGWKALLYGNNSTTAGKEYYDTSSSSNLIATATGGDLVGAASISSQIKYDEDGLAYTGNSWTAGDNGSNSCNNWTNATTSYSGRFGNTTATTSYWFSRSQTTCDKTTYHLYCVQQ